jgi:hypothetical protein
MRDQVLHPYKTTGKIIILYILILYSQLLEKEYKMTTCYNF